MTFDPYGNLIPHLISISSRTTSERESWGAPLPHPRDGAVVVEGPKVRSQVVGGWGRRARFGAQGETPRREIWFQTVSNLHVPRDVLGFLATSRPKPQPHV
ncbi:hypothetical protein RRG08_011740 [Elysia crispata]|uniref:Uncharacterized protein n=1 Tax=Elysia crispata TaxID=231223 RepID=A0AAE1AEH8_9GAST|nr:hypothetical protein RRG08_011740 [Elysia crispata]